MTSIEMDGMEGLHFPKGKCPIKCDSNYQGAVLNSETGKRSCLAATEIKQKCWSVDKWKNYCNADKVPSIISENSKTINDEWEKVIFSCTPKQSGDNLIPSIGPLFTTHCPGHVKDAFSDTVYRSNSNQCTAWYLGALHNRNPTTNERICRAETKTKFDCWTDDKFPHYCPPGSIPKIVKKESFPDGHDLAVFSCKLHDYFIPFYAYQYCCYYDICGSLNKAEICPEIYTSPNLCNNKKFNAEYFKQNDAVKFYDPSIDMSTKEGRNEFKEKYCNKKIRIGTINGETRPFTANIIGSCGVEEAKMGNRFPPDIGIAICVESETIKRNEIVHKVYGSDQIYYEIMDIDISFFDRMKQILSRTLSNEIKKIIKDVINAVEKGLVHAVQIFKKAKDTISHEITGINIKCDSKTDECVRRCHSEEQDCDLNCDNGYEITFDSSYKPWYGCSKSDAEKVEISQQNNDIYQLINNCSGQQRCVLNLWGTDQSNAPYCTQGYNILKIPFYCQ